MWPAYFLVLNALHFVTTLSTLKKTWNPRNRYRRFLEIRKTFYVTYRYLQQHLRCIEEKRYKIERKKRAEKEEKQQQPNKRRLRSKYQTATANGDDVHEEAQKHIMQAKRRRRRRSRSKSSEDIKRKIRDLTMITVIIQRIRWLTRSLTHSGPSAVRRRPRCIHFLCRSNYIVFSFFFSVKWLRNRSEASQPRISVSGQAGPRVFHMQNIEMNACMLSAHGRGWK